jgi:tripartite-type tricarboxylate transporter receptor subunit TctC
LDVLARAISNELSPALGQTIVVENRSGASGVPALEVVARAPGDGHTLVIVSNTFIMLPVMFKSLPFDIFKDFAPVIELGHTPTVITVHPGFAARDLQQFIAVAKQAKGGVSYTSPGPASVPRLAGELLAREANIPLVHVPYRGTQPAVMDLIAGQIPMMMAPLNAVLEFFNDKKLFPIAMTDAVRTKYLPDVPTLREAGLPNMPQVTSRFAILTTGGTPPEVVKRLNMEIGKILRDPGIQERLTSQTFEVRGGSTDELSKLIRSDAASMAKIVAELNIAVQ